MAFYGLENFRSVVVKNTVVKLLECLFILLFVKQPADLWKYTFIASGGICIGQAVMIPQAIKVVKPIGYEYADIKNILYLCLFFLFLLLQHPCVQYLIKRCWVG